jgi:hypothetical protein
VYTFRNRVADSATCLGCHGFLNREPSTVSYCYYQSDGGTPMMVASAGNHWATMAVLQEHASLAAVCALYLWACVHVTYVVRMYVYVCLCKCVCFRTDICIYMHVYA